MLRLDDPHTYSLYRRDRLRDSCVCLMAMRRSSSLLALCAVTAAFNGTLPQRRQLRKTAGEHMDGVKAWVRQKANNDAPGLVNEIRELRANAGDCDFDVKNASTRTTACPARRCGTGARGPAARFR